MARNIEIKARVANLNELVARVSPLACSGPERIFQDDTFFECSEGRLKLRKFSADAGELIFYRRANQTGPKESFYVRSPTASPESLREALTLAYGATGRVIKNRIVYMVGRTRVHLDTVQGLGTFMELEVVLQDEESAEQGEQEAQALMQQLGVAQEHLEARAYVDLLRMHPHAAYCALLTPETLSRMELIQSEVMRLLPQAVPCMAYGMPAYRSGRIFFYLGVFKKHIGVYPPVTADANLLQALSPYRGPKGNLSFPLSAPLPIELIGRVAVALHAQYAR